MSDRKSLAWKLVLINLPSPGHLAPFLHSFVSPTTD
jgi:hypothetical protein